MKKSQLFISFVKPDFKVIQSKRVFDKAGTCIFAGAFLFSQYDSVIMTIPGIGYINGGMILGEIGNIHRFSSQGKLLSFAGLDPCVYLIDRSPGDFFTVSGFLSVPLSTNLQIT